jgi:putative ABC transport system permease protein
MVTSPGWLLAAVVAVLTALATAVAWMFGIGMARGVALAMVRASIQLFVVSTVLVFVLHSGIWTAAFVAMMLTVASFTSERRIGKEIGWPLWTVVPIASGVSPVLALVLSTGVVPLRPQAVLPIAGIIIGGAMSGTSLTGRIAVGELRSRWGQYEAALSLGFNKRDASLLVTRPSVGTALVPALDQTRTVGLVTLPGAFIGVLLGGGSAAQAGEIQVLVLVGILASQVVALVVTLEIIARHPAGIRAGRSLH